MLSQAEQVLGTHPSCRNRCSQNPCLGGTGISYGHGCGRWTPPCPDPTGNGTADGHSQGRVFLGACAQHRGRSLAQEGRRSRFSYRLCRKRPQENWEIDDKNWLHNHMCGRS